MGDPERGETPKTVSRDNIVTWDGPDDPTNPKNWSFGRKWLVTSLVSLMTFMSLVVSSMIAPSQDAIGRDLNIPSGFRFQLVFSIFFIPFMIGPLLLGPLSE